MLTVLEDIHGLVRRQIVAVTGDKVDTLYIVQLPDAVAETLNIWPVGVHQYHRESTLIAEDAGHVQFQIKFDHFAALIVVINQWLNY